MRKVEHIIFRHLTFADYFNIYKPSGSEARGGGQTYIDFATGYISSENWERFFKDVQIQEMTRTEIGPRWVFQINSIGLTEDQIITIYQRRPQTFSIAAQRIGSINSNRVLAWHPSHGFPYPQDPNDRHARPEGLVIFLIKCSDFTI